MIMEKKNKRLSASDLMRKNLEQIAKASEPFKMRYNYQPCRINKQPVRGVNSFILKRVSEVNGYSDNTWITGSEVRDLGLRLKPGSKPTKLSINTANLGGWKPATETTDFYNLDQISGTPFEYSRPAQSFFSRVERYRKVNIMLKHIASKHSLKLITKETEVSCVENIQRLIEVTSTYKRLPQESQTRVSTLALHAILTELDLYTPSVRDTVDEIRDVLQTNPEVFVTEYQLADMIAKPFIEEMKALSKAMYQELLNVKNYNLPSVSPEVSKC